MARLRPGLRAHLPGERHGGGTRATVRPRSRCGTARAT